MKNFFPTTSILMLIGILTANFSANAQLYEVSLDEKIQKSSLIVEGRVVAQESYKASNGELYTANKVTVSSLLKGKLKENFVTVTTWGGETEDEIVTWSHMITLQPGDEGIFFLEKSQVAETTNRVFPSPAFDVYSSSQGFLKFARKGNGALVAYEPFHAYSNLKDEIFDCVAGKTGHHHVVVDASRSVLHRSGIRYFFKTTSVSGATINFDILVNSLYESEQLYKAGAAVNYNPDCFGANIATNGNLQLQTSGISTNTVYSLTKSNLTNSKAKIELSTTGLVSSLSTLTTTEQILAKGSLTIQNPLADLGISIAVDEMYTLSKFWEDGTAHGFDTIVVETDFNGEHFLAPHIIDFFPKSVAAGVHSASIHGVPGIITIVGSDFGPTRNKSKVQFTNAQSGPDGTWVSPVDADYLMWSDTLIRVIVPSVGYLDNETNPDSISFRHIAGTGKIRVRKDVPLGWSTANHDSSLFVKYCAHNISSSQFFVPAVKSFRSEFANYNGNGGYDLYIDSTSFAMFPNSPAAFKRALIKWRCATLVNFELKPVSGIANLALASKISFESLPVGVPGAVKTGQTNPNVSQCIVPGTNNANGANLVKFTMMFNKDISWHTDTTMPAPLPTNTFDLESVALHELGHAHLIQHTNQTGDLMHWTNPNFPANPYRRVIQANDLEAGLHIVGISLDPVDTSMTTCKLQMDTISSTDCSSITSTNFVAEILESVKVFPNPAGDYLFVELGLPEPLSGNIYIELSSTFGRTITRKKVIPHNGSPTRLDISDLSPGLFILTIRNDNSIVGSVKFIKQ